MKYSIYTLSNPIDNQVFYVGKTINLKTRFKSHLNLKDADNALKNKLIEYILLNGAMPIIEEIDYLVCEYREDEDAVHQLEMYWVSQFRAWGFKLVNKEGVVTKWKYSRKYSQILKISSFEFIVKSYLYKWDKVKSIVDELNTSGSMSHEHRQKLHAVAVDGWNNLLTFFNNTFDVGYDMITDLSFLDKRPYGDYPSYVTDYKADIWLMDNINDVSK